MDDILSQIIAYAPDRIDTETKARAMVQGPRNMYADSMRPGFYKGESVVKSHGQKLIELTEAGESSVSIAKKLKLKQQTVSNALNAIDKGIAGDTYKLSKPLKDFFKPKNQYSGKLLTENTELIEAIKEDAPTMSDKEIKAKHNIHKKTLKTIKDQNDITTRSSYLPEGTQKKSIPYADRYTATEKSEMYKKRKATETDEDRAKAKERDKKYRDKIFKEYKMEPSSRKAYDDLWKDIARSSKDGSRIQLVDGPKYSSGATYNDFKTRVFLDTKTGETFNYNNLKQYLDSGKLEGVTYKSVIEPYDLKRKIATSGLREDIQKAYFGEKYKPPKMFRAQNTFHVHHIGGVGADPFNVQLTFADENLGLVTNKKFNKEWASLIERNAPLSERKNYLKFVKSKIGDNIAQTLEFPEVGKVRTFGEIGTDMQKLLSNEKFEAIDTKQLTTMLADLGCSKSLQKASGGRIKYNKGTSCAIKGRKVLEEGLKNGFKQSDQVLANTILKSGRFLKDAVSLRGLFGPAALAFTVAAEAGIVGYDMLSTGKSFKEAVGSSVFNYMLGDKTKIDSVEERDKRMVAEGMTPEQMGKIKYFESMMDDMQTGFSNYDNIKNLEKKIEENTLNQQVNPEFFSDQSFQLNTQLDKARADNQDYFRTNKVGELENYFTPREDGTIPFVEGSDTLQEGLRRNELAQLQSVDNPLQSRRGDEKRSARIRELMLQNPDIRNYMGSYPTNYGFMEGGIASLNVKK